MAQKAIREADGMHILARHLRDYGEGGCELEDRFLSVGSGAELAALRDANPWLTRGPLVVKPDQLLKRRGKNGLILTGATLEQACAWIDDKARDPVTVHGQFDEAGRPLDAGTVGRLRHFLVEPHFDHDPADECYLAIVSNVEGDEILFHHRGGVNVGDVDAKARRLQVPIGEIPTRPQIARALLEDVGHDKRACLVGFIEVLFKLYADLHFTYLEINPLVVAGGRVTPLDLAAKLDGTADFESGAKKWGDVVFPTPFGREPTAEEAFIDELDAKTGASLKLTVLNPEGRVWTMVAGGGASVIFADTITDLGFMHEMANYGEYSGDPNEEFTYLYARTILDLMTRTHRPDGKVLLIGGGIANFTDVANTFKGIIRALREYREKLQEHGVRIYVRRGGPNYREGLKRMRALGKELGVPIEVHGPETHMTKIVSMALKAA